MRDKAKAIAKLHNLDTIILDGPPGIGCPVISTITGVDYVVIVTEPTLSGLHDLKRTLEVTAHFKIPTRVITNKYDLNVEMAQQIENFCTENGVRTIAKIPFDKQVVEAMIQCKSIVEYAPESEVSRLIKEAYKKISVQSFQTNQPMTMPQIVDKAGENRQE